MAACWTPYLPPLSCASPPPRRLATWWRHLLTRALRLKNPTQRMIRLTCSQPIRRLDLASADTPCLRSPTSQGLRTRVWCSSVSRHMWSDKMLYLDLCIDMKKKSCLAGKLFTLGQNPSMGSVDSDIGYDMGSMHSDLGLLEDPPSLSEVVPANSSPGVTPTPFLNARPANPAMAALTSQHRETHNRSPISFREGRRASDTSLTQGQKQLDYCSFFKNHYLTRKCISWDAVSLHWLYNKLNMVSSLLNVGFKAQPEYALKHPTLI